MDNAITAPAVASLPAEPKAENLAEQQLAVLEQLLKEQRSLNRKLTARSRFNLIVSIVLIILMLVGFFYVRAAVNRATQRINTVLDSAIVAVEDVRESVAMLNLEAVNEAIEQLGEKLSGFNLDALNDSIEGLSEVMEGLSGLSSIFSFGS